MIFRILRHDLAQGCDAPVLLLQGRGQLHICFGQLLIDQILQTFRNLGRRQQGNDADNDGVNEQIGTAKYVITFNGAFVLRRKQ